MFFIIYVPGVNYLCQTNSGTTLYDDAAAAGDDDDDNDDMIVGGEAHDSLRLLCCLTHHGHRLSSTPPPLTDQRFLDYLPFLLAAFLFFFYDEFRKWFLKTYPTSRLVPWMAW